MPRWPCCRHDGSSARHWLWLLPDWRRLYDQLKRMRHERGVSSLADRLMSSVFELSVFGLLPSCSNCRRLVCGFCKFAPGKVFRVALACLASDHRVNNTYRDQLADTYDRSHKHRLSAARLRGGDIVRQCFHRLTGSRSHTTRGHICLGKCITDPYLSIFL